MQEGGWCSQGVLGEGWGRNEMVQVLVGARLRRVLPTASIQVWAPFVKVSRVLRFCWAGSLRASKSPGNLREGSGKRRGHGGQGRE